MSQEFDPPYDSPIEEELAWGLSKHLAESVRLRKQIEVDTEFSKFYIDLVAETVDGVRVGFECDGREYHREGLRDECRDALILGVKAVSAIYRFRGQDLYYHRDDCLFYILRNDPYLFSERGTRNIDLLASEDAKKSFGIPALGIGSVDGAQGYEIGQSQWMFYREGQQEFISVLERRSLEGRSSILHAFIGFAVRNRGSSFDELIARFRQGER
jgi:hypothetical protein